MVRSKARKRELPALIGRDHEYEQFATALQKARKGLPLVLLFEGEPGIGKTSVLTALQHSTMVVGRNVVVARFDASADATLDPVASAVKALTRPELYARVGGRRRAREIFTKLLPEWIGAIPILGDLLEAITVTAQALFRRGRKPEAPNARQSGDIAELQAVARQRPVLLLIDDMHALSATAVDRLARLLRTAEPGARLLLVGTVRMPAPPGSRPVTQVFEDALPGERVFRHIISPFTPEQLDQWLDAKFGGDVPLDVANFLLAATAGQPTAILELLERLTTSGALRHGDAGWEYDPALAEAQLASADAAEAYLAGLSSAATEIMRAASIFGDEFDSVSLARLLDLDELELEDRLALAVRQGLLAVTGEFEDADGDVTTRYTFTSSTGRAALHRSLPASKRRELEARLAPASG